MVVRVVEPRMMTKREARKYLGMNPDLTGIRPVEMVNGRRLYDRKALDHYLNSVGKPMQELDDEILMGVR
jgi:hypothetical protein